MKKAVSIAWLVILLISVQHCRKEEIVPDPIVMTATINNVTEFGANDGSIDLTVTGGTPPYNFLWSNDRYTEDIDSLTAGTYIIAVTDINNETQSDSFIITQPAEDAIIIRYIITEPSETGSSDGIIDITVSGGYPPYSYSWSNGSTLEDLVNVTAGIYFLNVIDQQDQTALIRITVSDMVADVDGNLYSKIRIGEQIWMKENLRVMHAPDGETIVSYSYNNDTIYDEVYGRLYTWDVTMNNSTVEMSQGICPCEWHVPSDEEFKTLEIFLGMTQAEADMANTWRGTGVGTSLKVGGNSGYDAQLSGRFTSTGQYSLLGLFEYMWTSTEYGENAWRRCLDINSDKVGRWNTFPKTYGFSVRCVKNE